MKRRWAEHELQEFFTVSESEKSILYNKSDENKLGFMILLKFFQYELKFPSNKSKILKEVAIFIAKQLDVNPKKLNQYNWIGRNSKYHKLQIRNYLGFHEITVEELDFIKEYLFNIDFENNLDIEKLKFESYKKFKELLIEPPSKGSLERTVKSVIYHKEQCFYTEIYSNISDKSKFMISELPDNDSSHENDITIKSLKSN